MSNLVNCRECEHRVAKSAEECPSCGAASPALNREKYKSAHRLVECKKCRQLVKRLAKTCPSCGVSQPGKTMEFQLITGAATVFFTILVLYGCHNLVSGIFSESPEGERKRIESERQEKRKGFHCLSPWDGSHRDLTRRVKGQLVDPDSFEHISTRVSPVSAGIHTWRMTFRAKNGFGGMVVNAATGYYQNEGCGGTLVSID